ncbi:sterile alpha motif domain-containing protein 9-like [Neolamprologus brichardi]|uniref:Sterile alpha motif domain-containing protein 9-like n=1 Tax=Neolamprologus brichardi TaxID=32507 RepID=A0A3Q4M8N2_NEOBR|nr:sterile alpha motif domain-containing protein 9-like [Neolamprologus brichardi]
MDSEQKNPTSSSCCSMKSDNSKEESLFFSKGERNVIPSGTMLPDSGLQEKTADCDLRLPPLIEDWTREHVKDWLVITLRVPNYVAQSLYEQEFSGACLASFEKQDLLDLGVPLAPAIQIIRQVAKLRRNSETFNLSARLSKSYYTDEFVETKTVSSDSGIQSESSVFVEDTFQTGRDRIRSVTDQNTKIHAQFDNEIIDNTTELQLRRPMSQIRPFDKNIFSTIYTENEIFPPAAGPTNLLDPIHEYQLLPNASEADEREILYEFTREVFSFAASCMNSRTNGTIHFGVNNQQGPQHGQVIGHTITSFNKYIEAFKLSVSEYFDEQHVNAARMCVRPPTFIQVCNQDGTTSDKWVVEVDVVPTYSETQHILFYTQLSITTAETSQQCKTDCLFVRDGPRSINILADTNHRVVQEEMKSLTEKVKHWASARKSAEEKNEKLQPQGHQGQRLKQLITRGRDSFDNSLQVIAVTDKCHSSQLEHLDFLSEMKLFVVLEFDPESDVNGTCSFYRRHHTANLHYPRMYTTQDSLTATIRKLNLFKQTSWIFCNGKVNEDSEADKPLAPSEWLKRRSGDISNLISLLCKTDLLSKDRLLVIFILHSAETDISSPLLETFCAIYRTLEGADNIVCICKDANIFTEWKRLVEYRCKEDITSKCIYELSLNEISSTIKKLKEPQTQSSQRYLPSTGSSSVQLTRKDEELFTALDILCENECENTEIETMDSFQEFKKKTEEDFYRGGQVTWWNFYLSEQTGSLPFIKRDKYNELYDLITPVQGYTSLCVVINLFHHPGCGGTTLAMHVLWNLRRKFRCAVVKNNMESNKEIATQVMNLMIYGKQEQPGYVPVLLLVDNWEDVTDLKQCMNVANNRKQLNSPMVIILNCERTQFPDESSRNRHSENVFIMNQLSTKEQNLFSEKLEQLKIDHKKPETFYAFMIMTNNFSETYIRDLVSNTVKDLDTTTQQGQLLSFLALLNTYVNGSYMSLSLCEELVGIKDALYKRETLDDKMKPYSTLLITFRIEEHGTYQAVRFLHQMIASMCLKVINQKHKLSLSEITINILHGDRVYKSCMGKDFLVQNIQSMLITRHRKEQGDDKDTQFSPLIEEIYAEEGPDKTKEVLERATVRFDRSATLPQALARYFCLKEEDFTSALHWALDAQSKNQNSYIADTVGQVYKTNLKKKIQNCVTPEEYDECLILGVKAVKAFQESQELAKRDEQVDPFDLHSRKRSKSYNTSGYVGETEVMIILLDKIKDLPLSVSGRYKRDKMLQFLKGHLEEKNLYDYSNTTTNEYVRVLAEHKKFLVSLRPRLKEMFSFFENYFTYLKPRSKQKEMADERNKQKVDEHFSTYIQVFSSSEEEKASEKARNPNLSLRQEILDQKLNLETKRADTFAGILQLCLKDKPNRDEMEDIVKKWTFIYENSSFVSDTVNFILANIVLHSIKPSSKLVKKYEELVELLNEELQKAGTRSNLTELYYLSMLLLWPTKDKKLESFAAYQNISTYITAAKKSFHQRFSYMFPARSTIAHFFLGKSSGLKRIVSKAKLDQILLRVLKQDSSSSESTHSRNLHHLWQSGAAWNQPEVQRELLRIKGKSENGEIYVNFGANLKILVRPVYLGDIRSGYSQEEVSFYLGFTMESPVAYDVKYVKN